MQEKLNQASISRSRKLFDRQIKRMGTQSKLVRIKEVDTGFRTDASEVVLDHDMIEGVLDFPPEMPILRSRLSSATSSELGNGELSMWDILPVGLWVKWGDKVAEGDILVHTFLDENGRKLPLILKVTQEVGAFSSHLVWHKFQCALNNAQMEAEVLTAIENFLNTGPL